MLAVKDNNAPEAIPFPNHGSAIFCACLLGILTGCTAAGPSLKESPLSVDEQQQAVLEIAPRGTSRDDVRRRLKAAGIEFTTTGNGSIFYLSLWNRPNGERWHIDVALLFDSTGKLYQTRTADSKVSLGPQDELADPQLRAVGVHAPDGSSRRIAPTEGTADGNLDGPERVAFPGQTGEARNGIR